MKQAVSQTLNDFDGLMIDGQLTDREGQFQVNFLSANEDQQLGEGLSRLEDEARKRGFYELKIHPEALEDFDTSEESAGFLSMAGYKFDGESYYKNLADRPVVEPDPEPPVVKPEPKPEPVVDPEPEPPVVKPEPEPVVDPEPEPPAPEPSKSGSLAERKVPADQITEANYDGSVPVPAHLTKKYQALIHDLSNPNGGEKAAVEFGSLLSKRADTLAGFSVEEESQKILVETELLRERTRESLIKSRRTPSKANVDLYSKAAADMLNRGDKQMRVQHAQLRDAYRQTLQEVRPMGGIAKTGKRSQKKAIEYLNQATQFFPTEWIKRSDDHHIPIVPKLSKTRAHYVPKRMTSDGIVANLTTNETGTFVEGQEGAVAISTHEFTHRMENVVPGLYQLEKQFRDRRTTTSTGRLEPLVGINSPRSREVARVDHFTSRYMGRVYNFEGYTEIMSTGTQALFGGDFGGLTGLGRGANADHDMRNFVLGTLGGHTVKK